jgi:hypothetical protein
MMRHESHAVRVEDRRIFSQCLSHAGWDVETWSAAREAGVRVDLVAEAEYSGPQRFLRLELPVESRCLTFQVSQLDGELVFRLRLHPKGDLGPVLALIIAVQDTLDADNHPGLVKSLIPLCDPLQIDTDQGLFSLS